ncbi:hypothetical protein [Jiulongibacter sediminis]|uniref:hypothetical protein n=1 Tax=Jiulongibacter sediminis TaxID=1605367 RepID=UPI0026EE8348|nr:hypothetical protein [Jiulongibacter sediminis]
MGNASNNVQAIVAGYSYHLPKAGIVATLGTSKKQQPTQSVEKPEFGVSAKMAYWGDNNQFPNEWEKEIEQNDTLRDAIEKEIDRIYAGGLEYGYEDIDENGKVTFKRFVNDQLEELLYSPMGMFAFEQIISDYVKHRFPVPELIFKEDKKRIIGINALPAAHHRLGLQEKNGYVLNSYFCRNWDSVSDVDNETVAKLWVLDPLIDSYDQIKSENRTLKYTYRVPLAGWRTYYPLTPAYSAKTSRWLDIAAKTTKTFDYLLTNQMNPKYHIEIDEDYMAKKYGDRWDSATPEEINKIMFEELEHFHKMLHGPENSGNNIISTKRIQKTIEIEYSDWTITPLKGDTFDEKLISLSQEADKHIQKAVGIDPSLQGSTGGSKMGGGSGSDKRESFNIRMATAQRHVNHILSPYNWMIKYNGITGPNGQKVKLKMVTPYLQTLNDVTPDQRSTKLEEK